MSHNLTDECELLCYAIVGGDYQTITVPLKPPNFFLDQLSEIWVTRIDVAEFLRRAWANISLIHVYMMFLIEDFVNPLNMDIMFLCPQRTAGAEIERDLVPPQQYVTSAFLREVKKKTSRPKFILAPYIQSGHWVLVVIDLIAGEAYVFDPAHLPGRDKSRRWLLCINLFGFAYKFYKSSLKGPVLEKMKKELELRWMECPQQQGGLECGYYVMRYMYEIVLKHNGCKGNLREEYISRTEAYNQEFFLEGNRAMAAVPHQNREVAIIYLETRNWSAKYGWICLWKQVIGAPSVDGFVRKRC